MWLQRPGAAWKRLLARHTAPPRPASNPKQAEAVLLLADALGIQRFNWLGWSSGGNTGLVLAALHGAPHQGCMAAGS